MSNAGDEAQRIRDEYRRRERQIAADLYALHEPVNLFFRHGRERAILHQLRKSGISSLVDRSVLEVGCGKGQWLHFFEDLGALPHQIAGIDLGEDRCEAARRRYPYADIRCGDAARLPWPDASFDIVFQSTVFSSILDAAVKRTVATEMLRVLRRSGAIVWYDFFYDNPRNPHVRGVGRREIQSLFPGCRVSLRRTTLAPPIARRVVPRSWSLAYMMETARLLNTHYAVVITRPDANLSAPAHSH